MIRRILFGLLATIVLVVGGLLAVLFLRFPAVGPADDRRVEPTPELLARGSYLARHVTVCVDCHSQRDWSRFSGPAVPGTEGRGGERFDHAMGFPGELYARNITPAGIGSWTDGELARAFTAGVARDGRPYFPIMPYPLYAGMASSDVDAVVAYVRTLAPVANEPPASSLDFPLDLIVRMIPSPAHPAPLPDPADRVAQGRYLATLAGCQECHTPREGGRTVAGREFEGGSEFGFPDGGMARSVNLTPEPETGLGRWDEARFLATFRRFTPETAPAVGAGAPQTPMPWTMYGGMTDQDLGAIFAYLQSLRPVYNRVVTWTPPGATSP